MKILNKSNQNMYR